MKVLNEVHVTELAESTKSGKPSADNTSKLVEPRGSGKGTSSYSDIIPKKTTSVVLVVSHMSLTYITLL